ncbi:MAG: hypothetical protein SVK44_08665 [Nitrospirota bacterium]|nr:hypothetical protein [Nitrospirota bacterium]
MARGSLWFLLGLSGCLGCVWVGGIMPHKALADDTRFAIQVSQETQDGVKAEMTDMLKALQTILNKTLEGDGKTIQEAVKPFTATGTQGHPEIVTFLSKYPDKFAAWRQMGRNGMHTSFSRIETLAATQPLDKEAMLKETATLLGYCYGCHATFTFP